MKTLIVDFKDLSDSKMFLNKKIPNFMLFFIYFLLMVFISVIIWMWFSEIDVVIKSKGIVRPDKIISNIINTNRNKVKNVYFYEGKIVKKGEVLYTIDTSKDEDLKKIKQDLLKIEKNEFENLKLYKQSLLKGKNLFLENNIKYFNLYLSYKLEEEQLKINYEQNYTKYIQEKSLTSTFTTKSKIKELKGKSDFAKLSIQKRKSDEILIIENRISNKKIEIYNYVNEIEEIEKRINRGNVVASIDGEVQVLNNYNIGDYIESGVVVLRIIPKDMKLKVEIEVENHNIGQITKGQKVKYRFLALPFKEYGVIGGEIENISGDTLYQDFNSNNSYKVTATLERTNLKNRRNEIGKVKIGMISNVMVIVRKKKIFYIVLEKLNFIDI